MRLRFKVKSVWSEIASMPPLRRLFAFAPATLSSSSRNSVFAGGFSVLGSRLGRNALSSTAEVSGRNYKQSKIGKVPVDVPKSVNAVLEGQNLRVEVAHGKLARSYPRGVELTRDDSGRIIVPDSLGPRLQGTYRTLTENLVKGVARGFLRKLQYVGVGYRAAVDGTDLTMNLGFSHQVRMAIPKDITVIVKENTKLFIFGCDKCAVGNFAAAVRKWRPPEPYKGKGIRYVDEDILRKQGKKK